MQKQMTADDVIRLAKYPNNKKKTNAPNDRLLVILFICLFGFYGMSTFVGYLMPNPFYTNEQFYFKQFPLA